MSLSVITHLDYRRSEEICCNNIPHLLEEEEEAWVFKYFTAATLPRVFKKTALFEKKAFILLTCVSVCYSSF